MLAITTVYCNYSIIKYTATFYLSYNIMLSLNQKRRNLQLEAKQKNCWFFYYVSFTFLRELYDKKCKKFAWRCCCTRYQSGAKYIFKGYINILECALLCFYFVFDENKIKNKNKKYIYLRLF